MKSSPTAKLNKRALGPKMLLALASLLVALLLVEAVFRLISKEKVRLHGMWSSDEVLGMALTPGFEGSMQTSEFQYEVAINDLRMRDHPVAAKEPETKRALVIGDSFVFGVGVNLEDSLPKALERYLNAHSGGVTFEAFNAGMPGTGTFHHLHFLKRLAPIIQPDLVLHMFFVGDDWFGNAPRQQPRRTRKSVAGWLQSKSALYRYINRFVFSRLKSRDQYAIHRREPEAPFLDQMENVARLLEDARATAERIQADFLVGIIPRYVQVYDDAWSKASIFYRLTDDTYSYLEPNRGFANLLDENGFWYIDLLPILREEAELRALHFPIDGHWNPEGNDFVASVLAERILSGSLSEPTDR